MPLQNKTILITGGAGFIGSSIAERLCGQNNVIVLDNLSTGSRLNLEGLNVDFRVGDCRDVFERVPEKTDLILHLGMASSTTLYLADRDLVASQISGSLAVFEKAAKDKAKVVIASSSSLYNHGAMPSKEEQEIKITDFYTECRLCVERLARLYSDIYGMRAVCLRMFSVYGGRRELAKERFANMIVKFILEIKAGRVPRAFSVAPAEIERDFIFIDDIVDGWLAGAEYEKEKFSIFNLGSGEKHAFKSALAVINEAMGTCASMEYEKNPLPNLVLVNWADTAKAKRGLGFKAKYSLKEGVKKTLSNLEYEMKKQKPATGKETAVVLEAKPKTGSAALYRMLLTLCLKASNFLYKAISRLAIKSEGGLHPKHRLINYHKFFADNISQQDTVLDVGCSEGSLTFDLAKKAAKVVAIDWDEAKISQARQKHQAPNIEYIAGDAASYGFQGKFNVVVLSNVLEHIVNRIEFLEKMKKLAPVFLIRVPMLNRDWLTLYKKEMGVEYRLDKGHFIEYTFESLQKELNRVGLEIKNFSVQFGEICLKASSK
ncbi:MAG: NAD-dependent epimerase/dehydratase family protein [Patescibacteria group bacterium]|nr:NAD-dependent epimerase/dehydratase family protein [Patescibacteria group bacterium]